MICNSEIFAGKIYLQPMFFKIEKCNIKLLEIKNIQLTYNVISETDNDVSFDFTAVNNTSEPEIEVTWMVWNRFQIDVDDLIGSIRMKKTPVKFSVVIPKKILNTDRWIALSLSQPFRTDAAQSLRLPVYQS